MPAPDIIKELVQRFDEQRDTYLSKNYTETPVRRDFIDPFFKALGWDIDNNEGYAETYRDVIHEDKVNVEGKSKSPDYSFRVGGVRKFFVEAKQPSVSIKNDPKPAFQLRRYGWSGKLPVSILTDFEELAVYDCTIKPSEKDPANKGRISFYTYHDYLEKWDEIAGLFSKQAILKGSFDRFADKKKRGTATVDEEFLADIEKWRQSLASNILQNNEISPRDLNYAVQITIDRIIFLRICEDRGIEPYGKLEKLKNSKGELYKKLVTFFKDADDKYNSGLFHFNGKDSNHASQCDTLTLKLKIDDAPLYDILQSLYFPNPYEFSVIPADILGQVYERFLGKIIQIEGKTAKIEEKPEVKKAGGVFYTPTYIVEYIVQNTVDKLLEGKTPKQVASLTILDPACGSGSFLIVAYQHLLDWHLNYYLQNGGATKFKKEIHQTQKGGWWLTTQERKRILLNNIYGVDIDSQAVEVTKLSLLLKVLEGESNESINSQFKLFHERALPDLGSNIKCGNSLISSDFYAQAELPQLTEDDHYRINVFDWKDAFPPVFKQDGFDAIIGNPPYGATLYGHEKKYLQTHYTQQSYQLDSYLLFIELSINALLKKQGLWGMIIPNPWLTNLLQGRIRHFVMSKTTLRNLVHFNYSVFDAVVDTEVVIFAKGFTKNNTPPVYVIPKEPVTFNLLEDAKTIAGIQDSWLNEAERPLNIFLNKEERLLKEKLFNAPQRVVDLFTVSVGIKPYQTGKGTPAQTKQMVKDRVFDAQKKLSADYRQYLRGKDINQYTVSPLEARYLKYGKWLAEPRPAADFEAPEKILVRQTGDSIVAALDTQQFLCLNNLHVLVPKSNCHHIKGVLALLNSILMTWCLRSMNPEAGEALAEVKKDFVENLPLPDDNDIAAFTPLAENLLRLKQATTTEITLRQEKAILRQIDDLAFKAFRLTGAEIESIE